MSGDAEDLADAAAVRTARASIEAGEPLIPWERIKAEPTQADVEAACPLWQTWKGTDQLFHGRRTRGVALTVRGEDWQDLLDEIRRAEAMLEDSRPAAW